MNSAKGRYIEDVIQRAVLVREQDRWAKKSRLILAERCERTLSQSGSCTRARSEKHEIQFDTLHTDSAFRRSCTRARSSAKASISSTTSEKIGAMPYKISVLADDLTNDARRMSVLMSKVHAGAGCAGFAPPLLLHRLG